MTDTIVTLALISSIIAGGCFAAIMIRKKVPLVNWMYSPKIHEDLDSTEKKLALVGLFFMLLFIILIMITVTR